MSGYAWRCKICQEDFSPDKDGWMAIYRHAEDIHGVAVKEACLGVVDVDTGEVVQPGWSPTVLKAARQRGYVADKDGKVRVDPKFRKKGEIKDPDPGDVVPIDSARVRRGRLPTASVTVVAKNVVLDEVVQLLFIQAMAFYDYENTAEDLSRYITESCVTSAAEWGLDGGVMFAELLADTVARQGLEPSKKDYDPDENEEGDDEE